MSKIKSKNKSESRNGCARPFPFLLSVFAVSVFSLAAVRVNPGRGGDVVRVKPAVAGNPSLHSAWAYYRMESTNLGLDTVSNALLQTSGAVFTNSGKIGGGSYFPDAATVSGLGGSPALSNGFTVRFWVKASGLSNYTDPSSVFDNRMAYVARCAFAPAGCSFGFQQADLTSPTRTIYYPCVSFLTMGASSVTFHATNECRVADWVHLVAIYDRTARTCGFYVNGALSTNGSLGSITGSAGAASWSFGPDQGAQWTGFEDECGLWAFMWSAADVAADYNGGSGLGW